MKKHWDALRVGICWLVVLALACPLPALSASRKYGYSVASQDCDGAGASSFRCRADEQAKQFDRIQKSAATSPRMRAPEQLALTVVYQVHVVGAVQRPGTYDVRASDRLQVALQIAGGIAENGSRRLIQVRRKDQTRRQYDLLQFQHHGDLASNPYLLDGDVIHVPLRRDVVEIAGSVRRPDEYELRARSSLADLVGLAGGFANGVAQKIPIKIVRYENQEKKVLSVENTKQAMEKFILRAGDLVIVHDVVTAQNSFDYNSSNIPGGRTFYPSYEDRVFVLGGVETPGAYDFNPFYSAEQYISMAGVMTPLAKRRKVQVIASTGEKSKYRLGDTDLRINPGDTVFIKESRVPPETWARIVLGLTSTALGITTSIIALSRL